MKNLRKKSNFRLIFHLLGEYDKSKAPSEYEKIDKIEIIEIVDYH